jgi:hypothetical protein
MMVLDPQQAIARLPETLMPLPTEVTLRSVFFQSQHRELWQSPDLIITLQPGERIVSVETIPPNPAIGAGTRVWIGGA